MTHRPNTRDDNLICMKTENLANNIVSTVETYSLENADSGVCFKDDFNEQFSSY